jgi:hypothetical protein
MLSAPSYHQQQSAELGQQCHQRQPQHCKVIGNRHQGTAPHGPKKRQRETSGCEQFDVDRAK